MRGSPLIITSAETRLILIPCDLPKCPKSNKSIIPSDSDDNGQLARPILHVSQVDEPVGVDDA